MYNVYLYTTTPSRAGKFREIDNKFLPLHEIKHNILHVMHDYTIRSPHTAAVAVALNSIVFAYRRGEG